MSHVQDIWMCGFKPADSFFFTTFFFPSVRRVTMWIQTRQVSFFPLFLLSFCWSLCVWIALGSYHAFNLNSDSQPIAGIPIWSVATASSLEFSLGTRPDKASSPFPALMFTSLHDCKIFCPTKTTQCPCKIKYVQTNWSIHMYINVIFSSAYYVGRLSRRPVHFHTGREGSGERIYQCLYQHSAGCWLHYNQVVGFCHMISYLLVIVSCYEL